MKSSGKHLLAMLLAIVLCFSLCMPVLAIQDQEEPSEESVFSGTDISELLSSLGDTDGSGTEDLSYELYQAFETNPSGFISAAAELQSDDLKAMAELLVYFAGYFDLDDFKEQVTSHKGDMLTESEQKVIEELLQEIDFQKNKVADVGPVEELPEVQKYNPYFLEKLVSAHVDNDNLEDEEFFETLSDVFVEDPAVFSAVIANTSTVAQKAIVDGVAEVCSTNGKYAFSINDGKLTEEQAAIISAVQEQIAVINDDISEEDVLEGQDVAVPLSTQVPTIGTMTYAGKLVCGEATTLTVSFSETTATSSVRTYWTEVYAVRNGKEHLKSSKSITIPRGATSTTQKCSITYDNTGVVYTLVKVYTAKNGTLLTQRQGKYSDTITGQWSIIVNLPINRNYKGTLALYHANGALQMSCKCLGLAEYNKAMTLENGNTPTGTYSGEICGASSNTYSYGPYRRISMVGKSGLAKTTGRTGIMIHGGDPAKDTSLPGYPLRCTHGCIRVTNSDQKSLIDLVDTLISDFYADRYGEVVVSET